MKEEIQKCATDFGHFVRNWIKIYHPRKGLIPLALYPYQERLVDDYDNYRFTILTKFRQGGFTTTTLLWMLWRCMFKLDEHVLYCCKTDREARMGNDIVARALDNLLKWLRPKLSKNTDRCIIFEDTGGRIDFLTFQVSKGRSIRWLIIDDAAFIPKMDQHWKAVFPILSCGGNCIVLSTPNKASGWFFDTYQNACKLLNNFHVYQADYHENPEYNDANWVATMKEGLGQEGWQQEVLQSFLPDLVIDNKNR